MDRRHARRVGLHPGKPGGRDPRRRAAHGLQPHPALLARGCCCSATPAAWSSPFNGEGISYAMESARFAAEFIIDAAPARPPARRGWAAADADAHLAGYADYVRGQWG